MRLQQGPTIDHTSPFTRVDAAAAKMDPARLRGRGYQRIFHGVYVDSGRKPDLALRARAALAIGGRGSFISHATSTSLWGGIAPESGVHISVPTGRARFERRGVKSHRALADTDLRTHKGLLVSSPEQSLLEMARDGVGLVDLVVAADSLIRAGSLSLERLTKAASSWTGRGSRTARRAAGLAREGVDSAMETKVRLLIVLAGLPEPIVNHILRKPDGSWSWRLDLSYPSLKLIIEYDGRHHLENSAQWRRDRRRREELDRLRWRVLVVDSDDVYAEPGALLDRVAATLREQGETNVRRTYKPEWRRFFPSQAR